MRQIEMMQLCQSLEPGQCFHVSDEDMREAAEGGIPSLLLDGYARKEDVQRFIEQISLNWNVRVTLRGMSQGYSVCRPDVDRN